MDELRAAIELARQSVLADANHDLRLGLRQRVWAAMGPRDIEARGVGWRRRCDLAIAVAREALPVWTKRVPWDDAPMKVFETIELVRNGRLGWSEGEVLRAHYFQHMVDFGYRHQELQLVSGVLGSAVAALRSVLFDESFEPSGVDDALTDQDVDPEDMDAAFFAAAALSDGPVWTPSSDKEKRLAFWRWWLDTAQREGAV